LHEDESLYFNEIVRRLDEDKRNLAKKIKEFESLGLLSVESKGPLKIYSANKNFPLYKEYKKIVLRNVGIEAGLKKVLSSINGVKEAFVFGSYAENKMDASSDIDIMVIGEHNTIDLHKVLGQFQKSIDREINVTSMSPKEFRLKQKDPFISKVSKGKKIVLI
jgi:predicted nucleotidyltransferase